MSEPMDTHDLSLWFTEIGICGCGQPEAVAALMAELLGAVKDNLPGDKREALVPHPGAYWTVLNWYDVLGLLEHGTILPGWLTPKGEAVLAALRAHGTDPDEWGQHCTASDNGVCVGCTRNVEVLR